MDKLTWWKEKQPRSLKNKIVRRSLILTLLAGTSTGGYFLKKFMESGKDDIESIFSKNDLGLYMETIEDIKLDSTNDATKEKVLYRDFLVNFQKAQRKIKAILDTAEIAALDSQVIDINRFLPMIIKESLLDPDATSSSWAKGYIQLQWGAIMDVNRTFSDNDIDTTLYDPIGRPSDNIVYGITYFLMLREQFIKKFPALAKDSAEVDKFTQASYNAGLWRISWLLVESGATSWDEFVEFVTNEMDLNWKSTEDMSTYGTPYRNFFDKNYAWDNTEIVDGLTKSKAQEIVNYVEKIQGIRSTLDKWRATLRLYMTVTKPKGEYLYTILSDLKKNGKLKLKDGANMTNFANDILLDNGINPANIPDDTIDFLVSWKLMDFYLDTNKYEYETVKYEEWYYVLAIVEDKMIDENFIKNVVKKIPSFQTKEDEESDTAWVDMGNAKVIIKNAIIDFNTRNRIGRSTTSSDDARIPSDPKYYEEYIQTRRTISEELEKEADKNANPWEVFVNAAYPEDIGKQLVYEGNFELDQKSVDTFMTKEVTKIVSTRKEIEGKPILKNPSYIVLHSTAANVNDKGISDIRAQFFVDTEWKIFMLTDKKWNLKQLNHSGYAWDKKDYQASWNWDGEITYHSIGIEVEALWGKRWNEKQYASVKKLLSYLSFTHKIHKQDVITHSHNSYSAFGRGRKQDPYFINRSKLGLPNNYALMDQEVAQGKICPNMHDMVLKLMEEYGLSDAEVRYVLQWLAISMKHAEDHGNAKRKSKDGRNAWLSVDEAIKAVKAEMAQKKSGKKKTAQNSNQSTYRDQYQNSKFANGNTKPMNTSKKDNTRLYSHRRMA